MILRCQNTFWEKKNFFPLEILKHLDKFQCILAEWVWLKNNMCLNGLKWLKTHFKTMFVFYKKVWIWGWPPPLQCGKNPHFLFFFWRLPLLKINLGLFVCSLWIMLQENWSHFWKLPMYACCMRYLASATVYL